MSPSPTTARRVWRDSDFGNDESVPLRRRLSGYGSTVKQEKAMVKRMDSSRFEARGMVLGGGIAGILAGIVMAMAAMFYAAANGSGFWLPVRSIAATWYGANALVGGAGVLIVGMLTHLSTSAFWGMIFAAIPPGRKSATAALLSGLVWGVAIWAIMSFAVMSWLNPTMYAGTVKMEPGWWFFLHLIYGGTLVITPGLMRNVSARWHAAEVTASVRA